MKYELLSDLELTQLESEFIKFLVVQGIPAEDWQKLKHEKPGTAARYVEQFSDFIYDQSFRAAQYMSYRDSHSIQAFQFLGDKAIWVGIRNQDSDPAIDIDQDTTELTGQIEIWMTEFAYEEDREIDMYKRYKVGARLSDGRLFKQLCIQYVNNKES